MIQRITPAELAQDSGCILVDVREYPEFSEGAIPRASLGPRSSRLYAAILCSLLAR